MQRTREKRYLIKRTLSRKETNRNTYIIPTNKNKRLNTMISEVLKTHTKDNFFEQRSVLKNRTTTDQERDFPKMLRKKALVATKEKCSEECKTIKKQLLDHTQSRYICEVLKQTLEMFGKLNQNMFSYNLFEKQIKRLVHLVISTRSLGFIIRTYIFAGLCFFQFSNFNLSIYYFDRSLKALHDRVHLSEYQRKEEIIIYKTVAKIFIQKQLFQEARQMAYKSLRKSWYIDNIDQQMEIMDLLGQIQNQFENCALSRYFHHRMCFCIHENSEMIRMSNLQLQKYQKEKKQFNIFDEITNFVRDDKQFYEILHKHYLSQGLQFLKQNQQSPRQLNKARSSVILTHRSPNRVIKNYHILDSKRVRETNSKELHFIKSKEAKNLKNLYTSFGKLVFSIKNSIQKTRRYAALQDSYEGIQQFQEYSLKTFRS